MSEVRTRELPPLLQLFRPRQQVKNGLVVVAPVLAGIAWNAQVVGFVALAFVALMLVTAGTYTVNDLRDRHIDAMHPTKARRPIARGAIGPASAIVFATVSISGALAIAYLINVSLLIVIATYVVLTTSYSLGLKHVPILELMIVAMGFVLRILAGASAASTGVTDWFLIVIGSGALMVIIAKRESEERRVKEDGGTPRGVLASYSLAFLTTTRAAVAAVVLTTGCIATFAKAHEVGAPVLVQASVVPFALVILEFNRIASLDGAETPEHIAYSSRLVQCSGAAWVLMVIGGVYG